MDLDKEYSEKVMHGGTRNPFLTMDQILNKTVTNTDIDHLAICKNEALAHLEITNMFITLYPSSKDFESVIWTERTELCNRYIVFLSEYENGNDIRD